MVENLVIVKNLREVSPLLKEGYLPLAGGTEVNRLNSGVSGRNFVSIGKIASLRTIEKTLPDGDDGAYVRIGAASTFQDVVESDITPSYLKEACLCMSSRVRRNMATLCGNIACRRDDSYVIPALLAVDAKLSVMSKYGRKSVISLSDYIFRKEKYANYFILALLVPCDAAQVRIKRYANTASSHGYITMAVCKNGDMFKIGLCVKNSGIYVFEKTKAPSIVLKDDIFGSKAYKRYLIDITLEDLIAELKGERRAAKAEGGRE